MNETIKKRDNSARVEIFYQKTFHPDSGAYRNTIGTYLELVYCPHKFEPSMISMLFLQGENGYVI